MDQRPFFAFIFVLANTTVFLQHLGKLYFKSQKYNMFSNNPISQNNLKNLMLSCPILLFQNQSFEYSLIILTLNTLCYVHHLIARKTLVFIKFFQKKFEFGSYLSYPSCCRTPEAQSVSNFFLPFFLRFIMAGFHRFCPKTISSFFIQYKVKYDSN